MAIGEELVVLSANCQGLQNKSKRRDVLDYLSKTRTAIICLQDTHWTPNDESLVRSMWNGDCIINGKFSNSRGVEILLRHNFEYNIVSVFKDDSGNLISLVINISDFSVKIINLYVPKKDSPEFFVQLKKLLNTTISLI